MNDDVEKEADASEIFIDILEEAAYSKLEEACKERDWEKVQKAIEHLE